jgi:outer membrane protein TolC
MKRGHWPVALALVLFAQPSSAQHRLTVAEAVRGALEQHPSVSAAAAAVSAAESALREAGSSYLPAVSLDAMLTRYQEPMVVAPLHGFDPAHPPVFDRTLAQSSVSAGWLAFDGGGRGAQLMRTRAQLSGAEAAAVAAHQSLVAEVVRWYAAVLVGRDLTAAHEARVAALEQERTRAEQLLMEGRAARVVLLRAESSLSGARAELVAAAARFDSAERELERLVGLPAGSLSGAELAALEARGGVPAREQAARRAVGGSAELLRLAAQVEAAAASVREAQSQWWPRLHLGGRYVQYASGTGDAVGEWQAGMQLSYPIYTAGARPARQDRSRAEQRRAEAEHAAGVLRVEAAVDGALTALSAALSRTAAWQAAVSQSEEVARIERLALETGAGTQTDYLAAEAELLRVRAAWMDARFAEVVARVELARATGELGMAWVEENLGGGR